MSSTPGVMPTTTSKLSLPEAKWVMLKAERSVKNFGGDQAEVEKTSCGESKSSGVEGGDADADLLMTASGELGWVP